MEHTLDVAYIALRSRIPTSTTSTRSRCHWDTTISPHAISSDFRIVGHQRGAIRISEMEGTPVSLILLHPTCAPLMNSQLPCACETSRTGLHCTFTFLTHEPGMPMPLASVFRVVHSTMDAIQKLGLTMHCNIQAIIIACRRTEARQERFLARESMSQGASVTLG